VGESFRLACRHVVTSDGVLDDVVVAVESGRIAAIGVHEVSEGTERIDGWLVPGFIDTHVHGGGGSSYATADPDEARAALALHRRYGTTTTFASLVSADLDTLVRQISTLVPLVASGELAGIHLEGPFLSEARCGAHDPRVLRAPDPESIERLLAAGEGAISMVTIAAELPGGLDAIERLSAAGVVAAVGHTDADHGLTAAALDAGATVATHLFNGMRGLHHRDPGPVPRLLSDSRVMVELICDGVHLYRDVVAMAVAAAGPSRVALVTDAMAAAGMGDGDFALGDRKVKVSGGVVKLVGDNGSLGSIAGSTLTMSRAFAFVVAAGVPIPDAAAMASTTPARRHELVAGPFAGSLDEAVGEIRVRAPADLCVVDDRGILQRVMYRGAWVDGVRHSPA
jgi:N-acetylglucosamine-6-phosphate deacetylase